MLRKIAQHKIRIIISFLFDFLIGVGLTIFIFIHGITKKYDLYILCGYFLLVILHSFINILISIKKTEKFLIRSDINISSVFGNEMSSLFDFGDVAMLIYNEEDEIIWCSNTTMFKKTSVVGKNIYDIVENMAGYLEENLKSENITTTIDGKIFAVGINKGLHVIYLKEITDEVYQRKSMNENAPFIGYIVIDNYQDIMTLYNEAEFLTKVNNLKNTIMEWANNYHLFIRACGVDTYIILGEEKKYQEIKETKFKLLDDIRSAVDNEENALTISVGIGKGQTSILRLSELAYRALNMALSRGGNQVIINTFGKASEYFGAKTEIKQVRSHVRGRVLSVAITNLIKESNTVLIMGHKNMDYDALGACLGMQCLASGINPSGQNLIVYDANLVDLNTRRNFDDVFSQTEIAKLTVSPDKAIGLVDDKTLIIVVDTNRPASTMQPKLLDISKRICVIDHHRKSETYIEDPIYSYQETQSSSSCELVTELLYFQQEKIKISPDVANFMLAGICLDTKFFKMNTSSKTFEMSMILKNYNATVEEVDELFKEEYEEKMLLIGIVNRGEVFKTGIIIATASDEYTVSRSILAQAAEDILNSKGINAAFVIGRTADKQVGISARSKATFNVQIIMEKMGGGGHFNAAATQINGTTIPDVCEQLKGNIETFVRDGVL